MFYDEKSAIEACEENPTMIFDLINEGHEELVDEILAKKIVNINETNSNGDDVLMCLLRKGMNELVFKYMKKKEWDVNHQNNDGDTFAHILVTKKYLDVMDIIKQILKNNAFMPNIRNKKGETILDKSINNNYIYTTVKILEDERFNNIDLVSFKNLYENYIRNDSYGKYSKMNNLEIIIDSLSLKELLPKLEKLVDFIRENLDEIMKSFEKNQTKVLDDLIYGLINENA